MTKSVVTFCIASCMAILPSAANAQWRIGLTGGGTLNHYTIDKHYMEDWHYGYGIGATIGISTQYDFLKFWKKCKLGVRADLNWTQKNHEEYRTKLPGESDNSSSKAFDVFIKNSYVQLPVMACASYGKKWYGFANLGFYSGYWLTRNLGASNLYGEAELWKAKPISIDSKVDFENERDQRFDFGFVGGLGGGWQFAKHWAVQVEALWYRGLTSTQKDYMRIKDPRYNDTFAFQAGLYWTM